MTANYNFQHCVLKDIILHYDSTLLKQIIDSENNSAAKKILDNAIEQANLSDWISYKIEFIKMGKVNALKYRFTSAAFPATVPECSYVIVLVEEKNYYFTIEYSIENQFALCNWEGNRHCNHGFFFNGRYNYNGKRDRKNSLWQRIGINCQFIF